MKNFTEDVKRVIFLLLTATFFVLPWVFASFRSHAPGIAVLCGIIFAVTWGNPFAATTAKITSPLLGASIVGMGCGMNLPEVLKAGGSGMIYTFIGIAAGLGLGWVIGKKLKLSQNTTMLVSTGTSICGGSAIAAAAPVLKAKAHEVAIASATVFALNAVALLIFPAIGRALNFSQNQFGYWAALAIHDTSSVVGAGMAYGETALEVGTTVKLARALWIVPVTIFFSCCFAEPDADGKRKVRFRLPWFIPGFIIAAAIVTYLPGWLPGIAGYIKSGGAFIKECTKYMMITTLFLIGANLDRSKLKELGLRPVLHGVILWLILGSIWCAAIKAGLVTN